MSLLILKAGILDTVQDLGRYGYGNWGVNPGGAMDSYAAQVANMLVGNCRQQPLLEIHYPSPQILFEQTSLISITGANFTPLLDEVALPQWQPIIVRRNTVLHFDQWRTGAHCYIAFHGAIAGDNWLNSYSTNLKAGAGGWKGRRLEKTDRLYLGEGSLYFAGWLPEGKDHLVLPWHPNTLRVYEYPHEVLVIPGHEWPLLTEDSQKDFLEDNFLIHPSSDRMGYRLKGMPLELRQKTELLSTGVEFGTVQLMPGGQLVVLMADHQTTGGYPRIAHVISAHRPRLAQLGPSDTVHFSIASLEKAENLWQEHQKDLVVLENSCSEHLKRLVC